MQRVSRAELEQNPNQVISYEIDGLEPGQKVATKISLIGGDWHVLYPSPMVYVNVLKFEGDLLLEKSGKIWGDVQGTLTLLTE